MSRVCESQVANRCTFAPFARSSKRKARLFCHFQEFATAKMCFLFELFEVCVILEKSANSFAVCLLKFETNFDLFSASICKTSTFCKFASLFVAVLLQFCLLFKFDLAQLLLHSCKSGDKFD